MTRDEIEAEYQAALQAYREAAERLSVAKAAARPGPVRQNDRMDVAKELLRRGMPLPKVASLLNMKQSTVEWYLEIDDTVDTDTY